MSGLSRPAPNGKKLPTQQSVNAAVKQICDIMRRSNCAGALQYVPELTWILFLRILDEREEIEADEARAVGAEYTPSLAAPSAPSSSRVRSAPSSASSTRSCCRTCGSWASGRRRARVRRSSARS